MANVLRYSVKLSSRVQTTEIGSFGNTNWLLNSRWYPCDRIIYFNFVRSKSTGKVKIDASFIYKGSPKGISFAILANGQKEATISIVAAEIKLLSDYELKGIITINDCSEIKTNEGKSTYLKSATLKNCCTSSNLADNLLCMLNNPDFFADATVKCASASILVHRNILSARSPVFAAMFKTQMEEGRDGVVDMVDMEPDVLQAMLRYVYCGKIDHLTNSLAWDLLFAADKYQLEELKMICVHQLKSSMAANNVFRTLVIGELLDGSLKSHAMDFLCNFESFSELENTEEWRKLQAERPALAMEVVTSIVKYLQEN